ncbi:MAG TPA: hypothetical protein VMH39_02300 [Gemmatimonadaceae bacterium]|nr:hypothetical protein [Gemmatimonadaceae bacterium]
MTHVQGDAPGWEELVRLAEEARLANRRYWRTVVIRTLVLTGLTAGALKYVQWSLDFTHSFREDQSLALDYDGHEVGTAARHHVTIGSDSAGFGPFTLWDSSTVTLTKGSRLTYLTPTLGFQSKAPYATVAGSAALALRTRWVVTTDVGTVVLQPGRYVVSGAPSDTAMELSVMEGAADAWPDYGEMIDLVHVDAGYRVVLPRVGPVAPPRKITVR